MTSGRAPWRQADLTEAGHKEDRASRSKEIIERRREDEFRHPGARMQLDQEFHSRRDVLRLQDGRPALLADGDRTVVEDRRVHLARIDHRRPDPPLALLPTQAKPQRRLAE